MPKVRDVMCTDVPQMGEDLPGALGASECRGCDDAAPEVVRPCLCAVQAETDAAEAARAMLRQNAQRALVLDQDKVVGILTLTDALTGILATTDDRWAA